MFEPCKTECCFCAFYKSNGTGTCKGIDSDFCEDLFYRLWQITCSDSKREAGDIAGKPCLSEYGAYCFRHRCGRADIFIKFLRDLLFYDLVARVSQFTKFCEYTFH